MDLGLSEFLSSLFATAGTDAAAEAATAAATDAALATAAESAATNAALATTADAATTGILGAAPQAMQTADMIGGMATSGIPTALTGSGVAVPEAVAASAPYGVNLNPLYNSQAIDPTIDAAARQAGLGAPGVDLSAVANSQSLNPTLSGAAQAEGLSPGINLRELGIGNSFGEGVKAGSDLFSNVWDKAVSGYKSLDPIEKAGLGMGIMSMLGGRQKSYEPPKYSGPLSKYHLSPNFSYNPPTPNVYKPSYAAAGGIVGYAPGGVTGSPLENQNNIGLQNAQMYPQSQQEHTYFATPTQQPTSAEVINADYQPRTDIYTGMATRMYDGGSADARILNALPKRQSNPLIDFYKTHVNPKFQEAPSADTGIFKDTDADTATQDAWRATNTRLGKVYGNAQMQRPTTNMAGDVSLGILPTIAKKVPQAPETIEAASGGIMGYNLGGYASGGNPRLLKGPGDGMSDNIPATIADRQPARLADGEFVVPADVVSHLGNGSTDAGAKHLYNMMDKVRTARTGKKAQGKQINPKQFLPA